jgi:Icc-related predicted phosphoesterase
MKKGLNMIIDCVSDLHGYYPTFDGGDILIIAGDLTARDEQREYLTLFQKFMNENYKKVFLIGGNHDNEMQKRLVAFDEKSNLVYLNDSGYEFEGLKLWGTPWTSQFPGINPKCCAFTRPFMASLKDRWDLIPDDVDILITHSPPFGILDQVATDYNASVGDKDLMKTLNERIKPKLHVFGHIHENGGKQLILKRLGISTENNTICVNASYVNERYKPVNKPTRITL